MLLCLGLAEVNEPFEAPKIIHRSLPQVTERVNAVESLAKQTFGLSRRTLYLGSEHCTHQYLCPTPKTAQLGFIGDPEWKVGGTNAQHVQRLDRSAAKLDRFNQTNHGRTVCPNTSVDEGTLVLNPMSRKVCRGGRRRKRNIDSRDLRVLIVWSLENVDAPWICLIGRDCHSRFSFA
jgi:hypothetical protein